MPGRVPGTGAGGDVIDLRRRRPIPTPPTAAVPVVIEDSAVPDTPAEMSLATTVEAMFLARRQSLTDPATAAAYVTSLEAVRVMLDGARARGVADDETHGALSGMLTAMRNAAQLL
ncbi:hypothetical protein ABZ383_27370 [Streptomyces sp. NPDC005900]|uniref:hypothetical protein n=1 Tax=Streptomyces sp. NPDC005900 TaxID=3154569 RepID=UPI0033E56617